MLNTSNNNTVKLLQYWLPEAASLSEVENIDSGQVCACSRGAHPCGWIQVPTIRGFLATVQTPKQHLDRFSRFAALTLVTNRQTDRRTDRQTDVLTTLRVYQYRLHIVLRVAMRLKTLERD